MSLFRKHGPLHRLTMLGGAVFIFVISYYLGNQYADQRKLANIASTQIKPAIEVPLVDLIDKSNNSLLLQLEGKLKLLVISESLSDIPETVFRLLASVRNRVADRPGLQNQLLFVFLSRDNPEIKTQDLSLYGSNFVSLPMSAEQKQLIETNLGHGQSNNNQAVPIYLLNQADKAIILFTSDQKATTIADDLKQLSDIYETQKD